MEPRPNPTDSSDLPVFTPEQLQVQLADLTERAKKFGPDAHFTYIHKGEAYTSTLAEAIDICGQHIARSAGKITPDELFGLLEAMHDNWQTLKDSDEHMPAPDGTSRIEASIERARLKREEALAKRAVGTTVERPEQ